MDTYLASSQVSWGARINVRPRQDADDCPDWVKRIDRRRWTERGIIVWQEETQHIFKLFGTYALQLLDDLRANDWWREDGIIVGEPVINLYWGEDENGPEESFHNPIHLSPNQAERLLELLERNVEALEAIRDEEEKDRKRAVSDMANILVNHFERGLHTGKYSIVDGQLIVAEEQQEPSASQSS